MRSTGMLAAVSLLLGAAGPALAQPEMLQVLAPGGRLEVPHANTLVPTTGLTVEAWCRFDPASPGGNNRPAICRKNGGPESYILRVSGGNGGNPEWILRTSTAGLVGFTASAIIPVVSWHHLAGTYDGSMARLYMDGQPIISQPLSGTLVNTGGALQIAMGGGSEDTWKGQIDALRIWSVARTQLQIQQAMGLELTSAPGLVASWTFNGGYQDSAGAHHATAFPGITRAASTAPVSSNTLQAPVLATIGTTATWNLRTLFPSTPYIFDLSLSGTAPGLALPAPFPAFPLNPPFLNIDLAGFLPAGTFEDFLGFTSASGEAFPRAHLPVLPWLIGRPLHASFVALDPLAPFGLGAVGNATVSTIAGPAPQVTSVQPSAIPTTGGSSLVIGGSEFRAGAAVLVGGAAATSVAVVSPTTILCTAPAGTAGPAAVTVTNADGPTVTATGMLSYVAPLAITAISPAVAAPGSIVSISGSGFMAGTMLLAGSALVTPLSMTATSLQFAVPAGLPCNATVALYGPTGQFASVPFNPAPYVSGTFGAAGPASGGATFFVLGNHFHPGTQVLVGGQPATVQSLSLTGIAASAPPGPPGTAPVEVRSAYGCTATASYLYQ